VQPPGPNSTHTATDAPKYHSEAVSPGATSGAVSFAWLLTVLLRGRRQIILSTFAGIALAVVLGLMKRPSFTSEFSFLAQSGQEPSRGGLASLAGQFGINVAALGGGSQPPQLYADLLSSREVLSRIAQDSVTTAEGERMPLSAFLGVHESDPAVAQEQTVLVLRQNVINTSVAARTTGAVTVRAQTNSPAASLEIAQRLLDALNRFNSETRQSQAGAERRFAEGRLATARKTLMAVEDSLQQFLQGNRRFGQASQLRFEQERLESEVALQRDVVRGLAQQAEEASIREVRDTPVITMIERPRLPVIRDRMGRLQTLMVMTVVFFALGVAMVIVRAGLERYRAEQGNDPSLAELHREWRSLTALFRKG
jgi:uncharacterized protein involved in exopolysaccharide biosynthesis